MNPIVLLIKFLYAIARSIAFVSQALLSASRALTAFYTGQTIYYTDTKKTHKSFGRLYDDLFGKVPEIPENPDAVKVTIRNVGEIEERGNTHLFGEVSSTVASAVRNAVREDELLIKQAEANVRALVNKHGTYDHADVGEAKKVVAGLYEALNLKLGPIVAQAKAEEAEQIKLVQEQMAAFRKKVGVKNMVGEETIFDDESVGTTAKASEDLP